MAEIIGVRFKNRGKVYYFDPAGEKLAVGDLVVVETANGIDCGDVSIANKNISDDQIVKPLKKIVRKATVEDKAKLEENLRLGREAYNIANEKIRAHDLDMKLVEVEYSFGSNKVLFYFTAEGRVDFRDLVKDLAAIFKTRIELRQIGVKDETKMLGGLGTCGRPFCCSQFLTEFYPVSIKMAKEQGLSLNPAKISGACGRLMCCLRYEQDTYERLRKSLPKVKSQVMTDDGKGTITEVSVLTGNLKVKLENHSDAAPVPVHVSDVKLIVGDKVSESNYDNDHFKKKGSKESSAVADKLAFENSYNAIPEKEPSTSAKHPPETKERQPNSEANKSGGDKKFQSGKKKNNSNRRKKPFKQGENKGAPPAAAAQGKPPQNGAKPSGQNPKRKKPRYNKKNNETKGN